MDRELTLRNLSPLVLHADHSRMQFTPGLDHIPGSTLRGAVAAHYLQTRDEDDDFRALFVEKLGCFSDLLPSTREGPGHLLPATARLCKRYGWEHQESLTDALLRLELAENTGDRGSLDDREWDYCPDPDCEGLNKRDRAYGYMTPNGARVQVMRRLLTGTSIDRALGSAQSGLLFSQEALAEGQLFKGVVSINGPDAEDLHALLEAVLQVGTHFRVGAARSRGLGLVEVQGWGEPTRRVPDLEDRYQRLNDAVQALWRHYKVEPTAATYFSLTMESHLILHDGLGWPVARLKDRTDLPELLGIVGIAGVTLGRHVIMPAVARGWNAQQGRPREDAPAIGRGSVLLFRIEPGQDKGVLERLAVIEREGLGRRRSEGFGRVSVCHPFHYDPVLREI